MQATNLQQGVEAFGDILREASLACGFDPESRDRLSALWNGFSGAGSAAMDMWPIQSEADLRPGTAIPISD